MHYSDTPATLVANDENSSPVPSEEQLSSEAMQTWKEEDPTAFCLFKYQCWLAAQKEDS